MSDTMKLALQLTAVDMMSGVLDRAKQHILSLGPAGQAVARDFDRMNAHITKGLQGVAVSLYGVRQLAKGIAPAGDLQEAMINVKMNLMESGKDAKILNAELAKVRATAVQVSKVAPFSAQDVVEIENTFLKAGLSLKDVAAEGGAAWAATALATITSEAPATIADAMVSMASPFNIKGGQFGELADYLQKVDMASVTNVPELMEGAKYVSGTAATLKLSWKEMLQAQGVIAQQGLRGSMGGTSLNDFLVRLVGASRITRKVLSGVNAELKSQGRDPLAFWDHQGKLKTLPVIIQNLRQSLKGFTDKEQMYIIEKMFGEQGGRAALALAHEGAGSWEEVGEGIKKAVTLEEKMAERLKGFNANVKALAGTTKTTLATLFDPMLGGLTEGTKKLNDMVDLVGQLADKHPDLTKGANYMAGGAVVAAGGYGLYHLLKGGIAGGRVLKGIGGIKGLLKGAGGTALGVAEGKAIQAATGVQPVFITNWPGGFGGGASAVAEVAAGAAGGSVLKKMAVKAGILASGVMPWVAGTGLPVAAMTAASAGGGYLVGTGINQGLGKLSGMLSNGQYGGDGWLGSRAYDFFHPDQGRETKNDINLSIAIDGNNRVVTQTSDPNTHTKINTMRRGSFAPAAMASSH